MIDFGVIFVDEVQFKHLLFLEFHFGFLLLRFSDFKFVLLLNERCIHHFKTLFIHRDDRWTNAVLKLVAKTKGWIIAKLDRLLEQVLRRLAEEISLTVQILIMAISKVKIVKAINIQTIFHFSC